MSVADSSYEAALPERFPAPKMKRGIQYLFLSGRNLAMACSCLLVHWWGLFDRDPPGANLRSVFRDFRGGRADALVWQEAAVHESGPAAAGAVCQQDPHLHEQGDVVFASYFFCWSVCLFLFVCCCGFFPVLLARFGVESFCVAQLVSPQGSTTCGHEFQWGPPSTVVSCIPFGACLKNFGTPNA